MYYITSLLTHLKHVRDCMANLGGEAVVSVSDVALHLRIGKEVRHFQPQFSFTRDRQRHYTLTVEPHVVGFIGWRSHAPRSWPLSSQKLAFKAFVVAAGLRTPDSWQAPTDANRHFIVKNSKSSFGQGIRGPFEKLDLSDAMQRVEEGEFYETFVSGRILKAWYWDGALLCVELRPPPSVIGDGRSTVLELASRRVSREIDRQALAWMAAFQGLRLEDAPADGSRLMVDFRYGSSYEGGRFDNENVLSAVDQTPIGAQLRKAGEVLREGIPEEVRNDTLFTLDAVVDSEDRVWLLEMNSNPMVHPDAYPAMLRSAFEAQHA